jgi:hypothetical protein
MREKEYWKTNKKINQPKEIFMGAKQAVFELNP